MAEDSNPAGLQAGDLCHHGSNLLPTYRVIWIDEDKAWLRDVNSGQDAVVALGHCHKLVGGSPFDTESEGSAPEPRGLTWPDGTPRP